MLVSRKNLYKELENIGGWCSVIFLFLLVLGIFSLPILQSRGIYKPDPDTYSGIVAKKNIAIGETNLGSVVNYYLIIESGDKIPFRVRVNDDIYKRAEVGMYVKKSEAGIEFSTALSAQPAN